MLTNGLTENELAVLFRAHLEHVNGRPLFRCAFSVPLVLAQ